MENKKNMTLVDGQMMIIGKNVSHEEDAVNCTSGYCFNFEVIKTLGKDKNFDEIIDFLESVKYTKTNAEWALPTMKKIAEQIEEKRIGYYEYCKNLVMQIIIESVQRLSKKKSEKTLLPKTPDDLRIEKIESYFNHTVGGNIKNASAFELAKDLRISERQLNRVFQGIYGKSFLEKINEIKIEHSPYLLMYRKYTINQVADRWGWSEKTFSKNFKKYMGITPYRFINKNKGEK
jgi:AraC-like DNA-binding protein